ncbi:hypothetical protein UlMin_043595 [Ulmus minor]
MADQDKGYALSGKIMLSAIVILFFVVVLMVCLHLYARWYLLRARRRHSHRRNRRTNIVFHADPSSAAVTNRGLDSSVLNSLPVFVFSSKTHPESESPTECAVCLSEFEENEKGRLLPKCNHSFHIECIDMWFHSHSTCPLCRSPVEPGPESEARNEVCIAVDEPAGNEAGPSSGSGSSSFATRRKPVELPGIEVPRRNESFGRVEDELGCNSPASQSSFRSPMGRMLSFKRILSRDRRAGVSPSGNASTSCASVNESDIERGTQ